MALLTNKRRRKLEARGREEIWDMAEVYREANQAFAQLLLESMGRCGELEFHATKVVDGEAPMCGCPKCAHTRTVMTTHLRSIAVQRALVDALMLDIGRAVGVPVKP